MKEPSELIGLYNFLKEQKGAARTFGNLCCFKACDFFVPQRLIAWLISRIDFSKLPTGPFIKYSVYQSYYKSDILSLTLSVDDKEKALQLPYKLEIDWVTQPNGRIFVDDIVSKYSMTQELQELTRANLEAFLKAKPNTYDGPTIRLSSFKRDGSNYRCSLERTSYYYDARTELTIDYPLHGSPPTLRVMDLGQDNNLKPLKESLLNNSLGVSAVVYYQSEQVRHFFTKRRKSSEGVFEEMYGTVSGVCQYIEGQPITELMAFAQSEIMREFNLETGQKSDATVVEKIVPLAFTRDLMRGGKPQFFFLIKIFEPNMKDFRARFECSSEGLEEFHDSFVQNKLSPSTSLSPEFAVNLLLAARYFQHEERKPLEPVVLH